MTPSPRVRSPADRKSRADAILDVASGLLESSTFETLTVAEIARKAGIAKGSVFNYFSTKEALGLALAEREFVSLFDALDLALAPARAPISVGRLAGAVTLSVIGHPALRRLLPLVGPVFEFNVGESEARTYKAMMLTRMTATGATLDGLFPAFQPGDGLRFLRVVEALITGLGQLAEPSPAVRSVLAVDEFAPLRVDFAREFTNALHHYLTGAARLQG
jgi:TetR/AcrR family transcriptional regulator